MSAQPHPPAPVGPHDSASVGTSGTGAGYGAWAPGGGAYDGTHAPLPRTQVQPYSAFTVAPQENPYAAYGSLPQLPDSNGLAVAAFVLGLWGFLVTWIPFFIGLILGGVPNLLAVIFGICAIVRANRIGRGMGLAIAGLILGGLAGISILFGAGTIW